MGDHAIRKREPLKYLYPKKSVNGPNSEKKRRNEEI